MWHMFQTDPFVDAYQYRAFMYDNSGSEKGVTVWIKWVSE